MVSLCCSVAIVLVPAAMMAVAMLRNIIGGRAVVHRRRCVVDGRRNIVDRPRVINYRRRRYDIDRRRYSEDDADIDVQSGGRGPCERCEYGAEQ